MSDRCIWRDIALPHYSKKKSEPWKKWRVTLRRDLWIRVGRLSFVGRGEGEGLQAQLTTADGNLLTQSSPLNQGERRTTNLDPFAPTAAHSTRQSMNTHATIASLPRIASVSRLV